MSLNFKKKKKNISAETLDCNDYFKETFGVPVLPCAERCVVVPYPDHGNLAAVDGR